VWLLPPSVIIKTVKPDWDSEYKKEGEEYKKLEAWQGRVVPICYGETLYDGTCARIFSYCGTSLNERQDIEPDKLGPMVKEALKLLAQVGIVHENLTLANVLFDGRAVWIIDFEQTSNNTEELNIDAEVLNILDWFTKRQAQIRKGH
jgi:predicted Ser/Thr protein kinase